MHSRSNPRVFSTFYKTGCPSYSVEGGTFERKAPKTKLLGFSTKERKINSLIYTRNILGNGNSEFLYFHICHFFGSFSGM